MSNAHYLYSALLSLSALLALACGSTAPPVVTPASVEGDQVTQGKALYVSHCASCHGNSGEGIAGKVPAVVGAGALPLDPPAGAKVRKTQFHNASDVFAWVKGNMPPGGAGSLTDAQYAAVLAFDLKANGVELTGKTVDTSSAAGIVLHP
jgi:mono/diheme cytochrome c family protein